MSDHGDRDDGLCGGVFDKVCGGDGRGGGLGFCRGFRGGDPVAEDFAEATAEAAVWRCGSSRTW